MTEIPTARTRSGLFDPRALKRLGTGFLDLLFPPTCLYCGRVDFHFCPECQRALQDVPLVEHPAEMPPLMAILSSGLHDGLLQAAVQALKYQNMPEVARPLGQRLAQLLDHVDWEIDLIVPVPLHEQRLLQRGYNQAGEVAQHLADASGIPFVPEASQRTRFTQTQVGLNREQRLQNVIESFGTDTNLVQGKSILIVDDVKTTGATLAACAQPMLESGATAVYAVTVTAAT